MSRTSTQFRRLALALPDAVESAHMGHPDFRLNNRIFATLSAESSGSGMVKLTQDQQSAFVAEMPEVFSPVPGGWGRARCTLIRLDAGEDVMKGALETAYRNLRQKQAAKKPARKAVITSPPHTILSKRPKVKTPKT